MTEIDRGKLASLAGFATPAVLLVLTVVALVDNTFGWQGGAYVVALFWIALGSAAAGGLVRVAAAGSWRSAGSGMVLAGATGVAFSVVLVGAFLWAISTFTP